MNIPSQHTVISAKVRLNVLELGDPQGRCLIMLHGLRDSAWSLLPIAERLLATGEKPGYRILIPELRGHGASDTSDAYALSNFVLDLHRVVQTLNASPCSLFGHSLGGHIVTRYAAVFPELVQQLIVVEGMGPPHMPHEDDPILSMQKYRGVFAQQYDRITTPKNVKARPIADLDDVIARLTRNNPRMDPSSVARLAPHMVRPTSAGLSWAFDSNASAVFIDNNRAQDKLFWRQITAPVCVVSGVLSYQYWANQMPAPGFTGQFAEGEMEALVKNFVTHEHHWFEHSGHMVHYDEPEHLVEVCLEFLESGEK